MQTQNIVNLNARIVNAPEIVDEETEHLIEQYRFAAQRDGHNHPPVIALDAVIRSRQAAFVGSLRAAF
jgi:hypothetical protein